MFFTLQGRSIYTYHKFQTLRKNFSRYSEVSGRQNILNIGKMISRESAYEYVRS